MGAGGTTEIGGWKKPLEQHRNNAAPAESEEAPLYKVKAEAALHSAARPGQDLYWHPGSVARASRH